MKFPPNYASFYWFSLTRYDAQSSQCAAAIAFLMEQKSMPPALVWSVVTDRAQIPSDQKGYLIDNWQQVIWLPDNSLPGCLYVPIVPFWIKPWRIGLFPKPFYRLS
jgi:hypothetical protein